MESTGIAAKAFIVKDGKLLIIKRRPDDPHKPGGWDIPGGRLDPGEDAVSGVKRETKEEAHMDIGVIRPLRISAFTRDDGQRITMTIFLCNALSDGVTLSEEHTEYRWVDPKDAPEWLKPAVKNFLKYAR